jgi:hypothetical protein
MKFGIADSSFENDGGFEKGFGVPKQAKNHDRTRALGVFRRVFYRLASCVQSHRKTKPRSVNPRNAALNAPKLAFALPISQRTRLKGSTSMDMKTQNTNHSDPDQLPIDLNDLISAIQSLPEKHQTELTQPLNRVVEYTKRRRRILNLIQEALSQLRMDMKYLMFDLEATRRERDELKNAFGDDQ